MAYIKREDAINEVLALGRYSLNKSERVAFSLAYKKLRELPTADVVEVKHGKWVYHECVSSHDGTKSGYSCSECDSFVDEEMFDTDEFHKNFCGHCGAKMDGKEDA